MRVRIPPSAPLSPTKQGFEVKISLCKKEEFVRTNKQVLKSQPSRCGRSLMFLYEEEILILARIARRNPSISDLGHVDRKIAWKLLVLGLVMCNDADRFIATIDGALWLENDNWYNWPDWERWF